MKVKIFKPSKNAMQSGRAKTQDWVLEYERPGEQGPEALMGWTQSSDTLNQVKLYFDSETDAVAYAQSKNWNYVVLGEQQRKIKPRNYGDNFIYRSEDESV